MSSPSTVVVEKVRSDIETSHSGQMGGPTGVEH